MTEVIESRVRNRILHFLLMRNEQLLQEAKKSTGENIQELKIRADELTKLKALLDYDQKETIEVQA
jgi:hypothetical protein